MHKYIIYGLYDPSGNLFYIGATRGKLPKRLADHISEAKSRCSSIKARPIDKHILIHSTGFNITIKQLDEVVATKTDATIREMYWIQHFISNGVRLMNVVIWNKKCYRVDTAPKVGDFIRREKRRREEKIRIPFFEKQPYNFAIKVKGSRRKISEYLLLNFPHQRYKISERQGYCFLYKLQ